jgi:cytochrome c6
MTGRSYMVLAILAAGTLALGGCKKETPPKAEAPAAAPAPVAQNAAPASAASGEELFKKHCAVCHPDGGNTVKPEYTLHAKALAKHKITAPADIVEKMRNPGPGMTKFDAATIPDKEATAIAEYVMNTFK